MLEIVGTRLISPFYGSSIYTWSALITTTMVALALGYAWGGRLGDHAPISACSRACSSLRAWRSPSSRRCAVRAHDSHHSAVLERVESAYGRIEVLDGGENLYLLVNGTNQSAMDKDTGLSPSDYARSLMWARALRPRAATALVIGLGAGLLPKALERTALMT